MLQIPEIIFRATLLRCVAIVFAVFLSFLNFSTAQAAAETPTKGAESAQIMREFNQQRIDTERAKSITDKDKQRIMFLLGIVLIVFILTTGGLGIAMGVYGKPVFVPHMIFAGLSTTLALVHAIVGIVWFYPF